eukprot:GEMP01069110.1.p1 GENE.GEMP01069110.1~~GEMP01069110.1.p1  ORF type:complete len:115 (-),score=7.38 GEMP01069110.1:751-1095(-)
MYITMRYKIIFLCFFFTKEKWLNFFVCDIAFIINTRVIYAHARTHIYHLPRKNEDAEANRRPAKVILEDRVRFHVCAEAPILSVVTSMSVFLVFFTSRDRPLSLLSAPRFCALW